jgi:UPF0755 protein
LKKENSQVNKQALLRVSLAFALVFSFTFAAHELRSSNAGTADYPTRVISSTEELVEINVEEGATGSAIAKKLFSAGVVESSQSFFRVAIADSRAARIAPGIHLLNTKISAAQALDQLLDASRMPNLIRVFEGAWNSEVFAMLEKNGFERKEIVKAVGNVKKPEGFKVLEGLLFPAQYSFTKGTTAEEALQSMIEKFEFKTNSLPLNSDPNFSAQKLLIMASIIQAEGDIEDFTKISRVILNRLKIGMPLQMDSTINYAIKARGSIFVSKKSTLVKSDYNTYRKYGLPPGPIGNPGLDAIQAALNPAAGDWLYFITVSPGDTRFTADFSQFNQWKVLYTKNRKAGAFN